MSSQYAAVASQKFTAPVVTGLDPALTLAVSVSALPAEIDVTGAPTEVTARLVAVTVGAVLTVTPRSVVATRLPEVPVMVAVAMPTFAALLAVNVSRLDKVEVGFGAKDAVTPLGSPEAVRFTLPMNPFSGDTAMVALPEPPWIKFTSPGASSMVKACARTVNERVVDTVRAPEIPVMVTVALVGVAVLLAFSVTTLDWVEVGFGLKDTVTPLGRPDAERLTLPLNPYRGLTVMVEVPEPP
jgi:hypothetical protein